MSAAGELWFQADLRLRFRAVRKGENSLESPFHHAGPVSQRPGSVLAHYLLCREPIVAYARLILATCALLAVYLHGIRLFHPRLFVGVWVAGYFVAALAILVLVRRFTSRTLAVQASLHAADLIYAALLVVVCGNPRSSIFLIFLFVIAAAAYRWGLREAVATAAASVFLMWLLGPLGSRLAGDSSSQISLFGGVPSEFAGRTICLLFGGTVFGYLADRRRLRQSPAFTWGRGFMKALPQSSFKTTLERSLLAVRKLMSARCVVVVAQDLRNGKDFVCVLAEPDAGGKRLQIRQLDPEERNQYLFETPEGSWHASLRAGEEHSEIHCLVLDAEGRLIPDQPFSFAGAFFLRERHSAIFAVDCGVPGEWKGRVFVLDSESGVSPAVDLGFLQSLVWEAIPSLYSFYILRWVRSQARADERLHIAHEIHDGLLQSLIGAEMQVEALRRRASGSSPALAGELGRIQEILHREILGTRGVMENLKLKEMSPGRLLEVASEMVSNFQRETGIAANFVCDGGKIDLPPYVCRQLASILQEGLTNVRKHSGARNVLVRLALDGDVWKLTIVDDGRGFKVPDWLADAGNAPSVAPTVIRERARRIGAEFDFASSPERGSWVEVRLRQQETFG